MNAFPKQEGLTALWYHFPSEAKAHRLTSLSVLSNNNVVRPFKVALGALGEAKASHYMFLISW